jgi:hypothetical protein
VVIFVIYAAVVWSAAYFLRRRMSGLVIALLCPIPIVLGAWGLWRLLLSGQEVPTHLLVVFPSAYAALVAAGAWMFVAQPRLPKAWCRRCRYDLAGNLSGVCPECGLPIGEGDEMESPDPEEAFASARALASNGQAALAARRARAAAVESESPVVAR